MNSRATISILHTGAISTLAFLIAAPTPAGEPSSSFPFHVPEVRWGIVLRRSSGEGGGYRTDRETTGGPGLLLTSPALEETQTTEAAIRLSGRVEAGARLEIAGEEIALSPAGSFAERIKLSAGVNTVELSVRSTDGATDYRIEIAREKPAVKAEKQKAIGEKFRRPRQGKVSGPAAPLQVVSGGARLLDAGPGTLLKILGREQDSYRVELSRNLSALVDAGAVTLEGTYPADPAVIGNVVLDGPGGPLLFSVPRRIPAEAESFSPGELRVTFYNASVGTSEINLGNGDIACRWNQEEDGRASYSLSGSLLCRRWSLIWRNGRYELSWKDRPRGVTGSVVAIDPGHGGEQEGAVSPMGVEEKEANLLLARALAERLTAAGAVVLLTREDDRSVALDRRVDFALQSEADLLVSLHFNSVAATEDPREKTGFAVYHYQPPSLELARSLQKSLAVLKLKDNGVRWRSLAVLRSPSLVSALVETAFLSNPEDESRIIAPDFLDRAAAAIAAGIVSYLGKAEGQAE
jgi:N-acetylmuramoyl-L-alanine amidase